MGLGKKMCKYKGVSAVHLEFSGIITNVYCRNDKNPDGLKIIDPNMCCRKNCKYYESR